MLLAYLDGMRHVRNKGHWPDWLQLLPGMRECVRCVKGGHTRKLRPLVFAPRPISL